MADTIASLQAKADKFVADRHNKLNARQQASLDKLLKRIAVLKAAKDAPPASTGTYLTAVGAAPLPNQNLGQTAGQFYDCNTDPTKFEEMYGYTMQWAFDDQLTKLLRPTEDSPAAASRQAIALRFVRGEAPAEEYLTIIGGNKQYLGCIDISQIHDLGAQ